MDSMDSIDSVLFLCVYIADYVFSVNICPFVLNFIHVFCLFQ